jgi:PilZ domain
MLGRDDEQKVIDDLWESAAAKAQLPGALSRDFFDRRGPMTLHFENKRNYHRYYMRGKALLKRGDVLFGTYTKDVSRQGLGFLSPVQLMPKERVKLQLPTAELSLEVARCRRVDNACFECGARFALEPGLIRSTN